MKAIAREYFVDDDDLSTIKNGSTYSISAHPFETIIMKYKITVTYELPEEKIEITESQFDELFTGISYVSTNHFKEKLFGDK